MIVKERKAQLQAMGLPSDAETVRRTRTFVMRAGLTLSEMADLASLNPHSLRVYLSGHYDGRTPVGSSTLNIRAALKQAMDEHELAHAALAGGKHYATKEFAAVRRSMWDALQQGTAFLVDGPPGTQKTWTFRRVADEINASKMGRAVYVYARVDHTPGAFLVECCTEAGLPNRGAIDQLLRKLRFFLAKGRTLLIVDEAQHLDVRGLEVLRQLLDTPPYFGVILGGSHDLSVRLRDWRMEQWRSRLRRTHLLTGLSKAEASKILEAELGPMHVADIDATIADCTVEAVRDRKTFSYISARNLFFFIEDARAAVNESRKEGTA